jgi:aminoglycoside phosphotransferase (APT) family kinase protein
MTSIAGRTDTDVLRLWLEAHLAARGAAGARITAIDRRRSGESSSYASDVVRVRLAAGEELRFFLKDFGASQFPKESLQRQRDRELHVYRDLLARAGLGAPEYHGSVWDDAQGRFWLLLEFVDGTPLDYCVFDYWVQAAAWLGRLHGAFARQADRLRACDFLVRHDADFFRSRAQLALEGVSRLWPALAGRLADVVRRYESCVEVMVRQPPTLVHGSYNPRNILVDARSEPARISPVDWEMAAVGSALYDLAYLAYGFEPPSLDRLIDAYRDEARAQDIALPDREQMRQVLDCFRLHRLLTARKRLSGVQHRALPETKIVQWVGEAERLIDAAC